MGKLVNAQSADLLREVIPALRHELHLPRDAIRRGRTIRAMHHQIQHHATTEWVTTGRWSGGEMVRCRVARHPAYPAYEMDACYGRDAEESRTIQRAQDSRLAVD